MDAYSMLESWAERAAIMEFDAVMNREAAEMAAAELVFGGTYHTTSDLKIHLINLRHDARQQLRRAAA